MYLNALTVLLLLPLFNCHELHQIDMDKEDALICFEEVIKEYEKANNDRQDRKKLLEKRVFRKNREKFLVC